MYRSPIVILWHINPYPSFKSYYTFSFPYVLLNPQSSVTTFKISKQTTLIYVSWKVLEFLVENQNIIIDGKDVLLWLIRVGRVVWFDKKNMLMRQL